MYEGQGDTRRTGKYRRENGIYFDEKNDVDG